MTPFDKPGSGRARQRPQVIVLMERMRGAFYQFIVVVGMVWLIYYLFSNTADHYSARGMQTGFGFLSVTAGFDLDFKLIEYEPGIGTYGRIFVIGILNTLFISFFTIIASTALAITVGMMRLSSNWLVSRIALVYVEIVRNTPILVQLVFWHVTMLDVLPKLKNTFDIFDLDIAFINNRGFYMPWPIPGGLLWMTGLALAIAVAAVIWLRRRAHRRHDATGERSPVLWLSLGLLFGIPTAVFLVTGAPLGWDLPELARFNYEGGGRLPPAFATLFVALTIYHSAHMAETVRAGVQSVPAGQIEAARTLGLPPVRVMQLVLIPQAMRAIVPPMINAWVSLLRNTSLGIAIGYAELVGLFMQTSLNQAGHAIEIVAMTMGFYMAVSLSVSALLNLYNERINYKD